MTSVPAIATRVVGKPCIVRESKPWKDQMLVGRFSKLAMMVLNLVMWRLVSQCNSHSHTDTVGDKYAFNGQQP